MIPKASSFQNGDKGYGIFEKRTFLKSGPFCPGNRAIFYFNLTIVLSFNSLILLIRIHLIEYGLIKGS